MNERSLVFVYGSLLSGGAGQKEGAFGNHRVIEGAKFLGEHVTEPIFTMISLSAFPGVIENGNTQIIGEIYEITDEIFARLDRLEGYPVFYGRQQIATAYGHAWIYLLPSTYKGTHPIVPNGDWRKFKGV